MRARLRKPSQGVWYSIIMILISVIALVVAGILYTKHESQKNNQKWCDVINVLVDSYRHNPPTTPTGRKVAEGMRRLQVEFKCGKESP